MPRDIKRAPREGNGRVGIFGVNGTTLDLPVDFEKLAKLPPGNGYPYSIRAEDLMKNFQWCNILPSEPTESGFQITLEETSGVSGQHPQRRLVVVGADNLGSGGMWKVTAGSLGYDCAGGSLTVQGTTVAVPDTSPLVGPIIALKITRDPSSRAMTDYAIVSVNDPLSDSTNQYIVLAEATEFAITQYRSEEIVITELTIVENGEFKLASIADMARNTYALPA
jgi:hypothetical protein